MGELIAVLSGKGGTGKTSVCAAVSTALARMGHKVLAIDCDMGLQNLDISLGLSDSGAISFLDVCEGGYSLSHAAKHDRFESLSFLTAPLNRTAERVDAEKFRQMVRAAKREFDYIFLDAPAGIDAGFELAAKFADRCLIVTGADPAAMRDAARAAQRLELMGKTDVKLIVNRVSRKLFATMSVTVDDVMDTAGLPLIGVVPEDQNVTLAAAFGTPLITHTNRGAAKACEAIARRLEGRRIPLSIFDIF
ncbi:MAG: septum site-determining protein MinD [Oscillospiraceae bacterium]|nr:septum site-determining protein MinD [Oscillospiraceae bacterium]